MNVAQAEEFSAGVDVGGTFTDVAVVHPAGLWRGKTPTTHGEIGRGVIASLAVVAGEANLPLDDLLSQVTWFGLGTTAVTNVIAEVRGRSVGLLTTGGFEDELNLARGIRFSIDGPVIGPQQIVPSHAIAGIAERIDKDGNVLEPLDTADVIRAVERIRSTGDIDTIAISFVNAYRNPAHELEAADAVRTAFPDLPVVTASGLDASFGFLPRTMFAVLNAYSAAAFAGIDELAADLASRGLKVPVRLVNATGGVIGIEGARERPLMLLHSGPAAGVSAAASIGRRAGLDRVLACDMGGTSYDISVIENGEPLRRLNAEILRVPTSLSMVDVDSIGSGGGSIGWADARGMLRVGPRSAGSIPGPACYGWGGEEPTVTDALVVLGYVDPERFLGGRMKLDAAAAYAACERLGRQLDISAEDAAWGIRRIALADMTRAAQLILNRRGLNPADFAMISYGGCGSLFNVDIAEGLGVGRIVIPSFASVVSAYGAATAPIRRERAKALVTTFPIDSGQVDAALAALRAEVLADLETDQVPADQATIQFEAAIRFKRQPSDIAIPLRMDLQPAARVQALQDDFRAEYRHRYGESSIMLGAPMELVMLRAIGAGPSNERPRSVATRFAGVAARSLPTRAVKVQADAAALDVAVYGETDLAPGLLFPGPACIDLLDTTIWISPGAMVAVEDDMSLTVDSGKRIEYPSLEVA